MTLCNVCRGRVVCLLRLCVLMMSGLSILADAEPHALSGTAVEPSNVMEKLRDIDDWDPRAYGIRNNCIRASQIQSIDFKDDQTAIVSMGRRREIILTLQRPCLGIQRYGFVQVRRSSALCATFDSFEVVGSRMRCPISALEPHVRLSQRDE